MTYLKGSSTWGALVYDLNRLICGEVADSTSTTCSTPWQREVTRSVSDAVLNSTTTVTSATAAFVSTDVGSYVIGTGIPAATTISSVTNGTTVVLSAAATASASGVTIQICTDTLRTPASKDVASGAMSNRTGYYSLIGVNNVNSFGSAAGVGGNTVCKVTGPFTSDPSTSGFHRWFVQLRVSTANTVSGNYSNAVIAIAIWDADSGNSLLSTTGVPNSAGALTVSNGHTVSITDPSGTLTVSTYWARAFSATYMYGIDCWPMWYRASVSSPTFSVSPPGSAGTDYDVISIAHPPNAGSANFADRSNLFHGLGIKTTTGLGSNALYTLSFNMALVKMRIFNGASNGILSLDVGQSKKDAVNSLSTFRNCGGFRVTNWCKMFTTAGSVTSSSAVQYFLSVTADGVTLALNADPGTTGKLGTAFIGAFVPTDTTYDVFPIAFNYAVTDYTADTSGVHFALAAQYPYFSLRRRQDGSEGSRDWQTKWMRAEHLWSQGTICYAGLGNSDITVATVGPTSSTSAAMLSVPGGTTGSSAFNSAYPTRQNKPGPDGKWWLYGFQYAEGDWTPSGASAVDENRFVRGQQTTRFLFVPETGWGNGDELTDSNTGIKYLLLLPDYAGFGGRVRQTTNTFFGGVAMAEI